MDMIKQLCVVVSLLMVLDSQSMSGILETITIKEGVPISRSLANLTDLLMKVQRFTEVSLKEIKIYPISEAKMQPFRLQNGYKLYLSSPVDREQICSEGHSDQVAKVCTADQCCKLLGFQYTLAADVQAFFILVKIKDINDQEPKFKTIKNPYIKIPENVDERFTIYLPIAEDKDSLVFGVQRYTITQNYPPGEMTDFRFLPGDEVPPKPRLVVSTTLNYERTNKYKFKLTAFDTPVEEHGNSCSAMIEIEIEDVNDNAPKFELSTYKVEIKENELLDNILRWRVTDADSGKNGMVSVYIDSEEMSKKFQTTKTNANEGFLGLVTPLDYETEQHNFQFNLVAQDNGIPPRSSTAVVQVTLTNVNDNAPKIMFKMIGHSTSNTVSLKEGLVTHSLVAEVRVTDADSSDSAITCRLMDHTELFYLEPPLQHNTLLDYKPYNLKTMSAIDRESDLGPFIRITVHCSDGDIYKPLTTNETLSIQIEDVNDNPPVFSKQTFVGSVEENQINTIVTFIKPLIVLDKDFGSNGKLDFLIEDFTNSTDSMKFICDKNSGKIVTQKPLDFEKQNQYRFKVIAKDHGLIPLSSSATIIVEVIDLNDNPPLFTDSHHTFSIAEDAKVGTKIGTVSATDKDTSPKNKNIRYDMEPKSGSVDSIEVDKHTGVIRTRKPLDREQYESITFRIIASNPNPIVDNPIRDLESEVQVIVKVTDINDNPPQFKLKPNVKPRIEFVMEQYIDGSTCAELPYTVQDADDEGMTGPHCCTVTLENDYDNLFSLMTNTPSYICLMRRPPNYQSMTITLIAKDRPTESQKSLTSKISFPVLIRTDPNMRPSQFTADPGDLGEPRSQESRNIIIIAILTTVVLVFLIIIVIIVIIIRRCSLGDQEYNVRKCNQSSVHSLAKDVHANINCLISEQSTILQSGKMTVPRGYMPSPHYSDTLNKTMFRSNHHSQSTTSSPFTPPVYHQIMTNQGIRLMANPRPLTDQYVYEWPPGTEDQHHHPTTVSRSVINSSSSDKARPLSPTRSDSINCHQKSLLDAQHDSGYQILNPFSSTGSPQRPALNYSQDEMVPYETNENRSLTLLNNFYDEDHQHEHSNKTTPMTMKRNYFQTTFV